MNKRFAAIGLTAGLVAGAGAGLALGGPGLVGAASSDSTTESTTANGATNLQTDTSSTADSAGSDAPFDRNARLQEVLAPLVADGTITQAQADAVVARLIEAAPLRGPGGHGPGHHGGQRGPRLDAAAEAIGITAEELGQALRAGSTVAEVAAANGVDVQTVIDAMVAQVETHLAEEVAAGEKTQAEADEILANAPERITAAINGELRERGFGGGPGHHGPDTDGGDAADDVTTTTGS